MTTLSSAPPVELTRDELRRYRRHLVLPEVGREGQEKLKSSSVLLVGAGGLGSPAALYLAAAGVGRIGIVDFDVVDETNLQRQILHGTSDVGRGKVASATDRLADLNPNVDVVGHEVRLDTTNAIDIISDYDVVADGADNFATRYLVNDACVLSGTPNVHGSIFRFEGQASVFWPPEGPCYRCLYPEPPPPEMAPSCAEGGVLGVLPGVVGVIQAIEVVKILLGIGEPLIGRLVQFDALAMHFREFQLRKDPHCPICGKHPSITRLQDYDELCGTLPIQDGGRAVAQIESKELYERLTNGTAPFLLDVREPKEASEDLGYLAGSHLIPLHALPERYDEIADQKDNDVVIVCASGWRSATAARFLAERGFNRVFNLSGGLVDWHEEGLPYLTADVGREIELLTRRPTGQPTTVEGTVTDDTPHTESTLDIRGKICPYTLIETRDALKQLSAGQTLLVLSDYAPAATETIPNFCNKKGYPIEVVPDSGEWRIKITRTE